MQGARIATAGVRTGFAMTVFCKGCARGGGEKENKRAPAIAGALALRQDGSVALLGLLVLLLVLGLILVLIFVLILVFILVLGILCHCGTSF